MNFVFISPNFPYTYWNFCDRLKKNGVTVLGVGDAPYDSLDSRLKDSLTEYYKVSSLEDYDQVFRAVAFFSFKYGKIDWIESMNEYWLELDARLRTDFNVTTGVQNDQIAYFKEKSLMKKKYAKAKVPTARQQAVTTLAAAKKFIEKTGYPVIVKPDVGVGATDTWKLENDQQLEEFYSHLPEVPYVMEEFVYGHIFSYDAIVDSHGDPLFESMTAWPPSIMDMVVNDINLKYAVCPYMPEPLRELGRRTVKAFGVKSRFIHFEFFRLEKGRRGLGKVGDYAGLEVNMRPAGAYTPDMMNFAHSTDVYQIWADMVAFDERRLPKTDKEQYCVYAGRKEGHPYQHSHEEIMEKYGPVMMMQEEMPELNWPQMGRYMYTVRLDTYDEVQEFVHFTQDEIADGEVKAAPELVIPEDARVKAAPVKKTARRKTAAKTASARKTAAKKPAAEEKTAAEKPAAAEEKAAAQKPAAAAEKTAAEKPATKAEETAAKKPAAEEKTAAQKPVAKADNTAAVKTITPSIPAVHKEPANTTLTEVRKPADGKKKN
ncbi:MAG: ATP-grasp domain-containing protein [Lachnospiraceae bacterium]|jgi:hypothetical protein